MGTILQRGILILLLFCFPCWALFINTERLLLLIQQDPEVSRSGVRLNPIPLWSAACQVSAVQALKPLGQNRVSSGTLLASRANRNPH